LALNWVPEPEFGGIYAARIQGLFASNGLEVDIQGGGAGTPVIQRVAAGQVEYGVASADEVVMARSRGADVVALFAIYQTCPQGIMTHRERGLKSLAEVFRSGTLAVEPGLPYVAWLKHRYGFDRVKLVPYDGGVTRFLAEKEYAQQCFITSEPIAARRKGANPQVFLVADSGYNPYTAVIITRQEYLQAHRPEAEAMVRSLRDGWRAYLDDPAPANAEMAKLNTSMDAETFALAAEAQKPLIERTGALGMMETSRWETLIRQLSELKLIEKAPHPEECFVNL
jgi:NitT/TauT family transport system substrate-binding protein